MNIHNIKNKIIMGKLKKVYKIMVSTDMDVVTPASGYGSDYDYGEEKIAYLEKISDCDDEYDTLEAAETGLLELLEWYNENNYKDNLKYEYSIVPVYTFVKD